MTGYANKQYEQQNYAAPPSYKPNQYLIKNPKNDT